ncbi:MAG: DUF308 domain-containing protein [Clostridiales bacterium]|nr:DUF308 domain-containing protein [Clostridiales bacterium]MDD6856384.1 DUF308 domain-containing protein [Oscillospiraceae bacterium]
MYWNKRIQTAKIGYILISLMLCVLGVVLIVCPGVSAGLLCKISGVIMVLFGAIKIIGYFSKDLYRLAFQYDLASGILIMAIGVIMIARTNVMVSIICIIFGIYVLADALLKVQIAIDAKAFGISKWWLILAVAILTGVAGFLLVLRPSESAQILMVLLGLSLISEGLLNLITILTAVKIIRRQRPEIIDTDTAE